MKKKQIIPIIILIFIYAIAIKSTVSLYYFPYPAYPDFSLFLSHFPSYLLPYILLLEIAILMLFNVFPSFITNIKAYKKLEYGKIPISMIIFIGSFPSILAFINNYLTGNLQFSVILLIYGVLITLVAFKLRMLGSKKSPLSKKELKTKKLFEGLCTYILELDPYRNPSNFGLSPYSLNMISELLFKNGQLQLFLMKNPDIHKKVKNELYYFIKNTKYSYSMNKSFVSGYSSSDHLFRHMVTRYNRNIKKGSDPYFIETADLGLAEVLIPLFFPFVFLLIFGDTVFFFLNELGLNIFYGTLSLAIIFILLYIIIAWISTMRRKNAGKKYDEDIKKAVQELIDYGIEIIKKNNLNPKDFPIKLRHNDYEGLIYEKKGENSHIGYFKPN